MFLFGDMTEEDASPAEMPEGYSPRPYQHAADDAVWDTLQTSDKCGLYMATGCGKTEIAALLMQRDWQGGTLFITPRIDLVQQTADRLRLRGVLCGIEMAQNKSDEHHTVACYQSLAKRSRDGRRRYEKFLKQVKFVVVDESHSYYSEQCLKMLEDFRAYGAVVCGMTASPPISKKHVLADHYGEAAYVYSYLQAVEDGYLVPVDLNLCVLKDLDMSGFKASFGNDFNQARAAKLFELKENVAAIGQMVETYWKGMPSVVFATSIQQAMLIRDDLSSRHIEASIVHSDERSLPKAERNMHLSDFNSGRSDVIINVGILTMGWDSWRVRNIFIARSTASNTLYTQIFGRGTRAEAGIIKPGMSKEERLAAIAASSKPKFHIYDITDSSRNNSIVTALDVLYPTLEDGLMDRVRKQVEQQPRQLDAIDSVIKQERALMLAEEAAARAIELERRKNIRVGGTVTAFGREVTSCAEAVKKKADYWWMPYGKHKGMGFKRIHQLHPGYLAYMLENGYLSDRGLRKNVVTFLKVAVTERKTPEWAKKRILVALRPY